jgi:hypothetical protein
MSQSTSRWKRALRVTALMLVTWLSILRMLPPPTKL